MLYTVVLSTFNILRNAMEYFEGYFLKIPNLQCAAAVGKLYVALATSTQINELKNITS